MASPRGRPDLATATRRATKSSVVNSLAQSRFMRRGPSRSRFSSSLMAVPRLVSMRLKERARTPTSSMRRMGIWSTSTSPLLALSTSAVRSSIGRVTWLPSSRPRPMATITERASTMITSLPLSCTGLTISLRGTMTPRLEDTAGIGAKAR